MEFVIKSANKCIGAISGCLMLLVLLSSITSCERCSKAEPRDGTLLISLDPEKLTDDQSIFHLKLLPQDAKKIVDYNNYKLRVTLSAASGDLKGSRVRYQSVDRTGKTSDQDITSASVTRDLTHFFIGGELEPGENNPVKEFIIEPSQNVGKLTLEIELLDALKNEALVKKCKGIWEPSPAPRVKIEVTNKDATDTISVDKKIQLKITRDTTSDPDDQLTKENLTKVALKIVRNTGVMAKISTAPNIDASYILPLKDILSKFNFPDNKTAILELAIEPGTDKSATFSIEPINEWGETNSIGDAQTVVWENGAQLGLQATYDATNKKVNITITNTGKLDLPANAAALSWDTGDDDVTVKHPTSGATNSTGSQQLQTIAANGAPIMLSLNPVTFTNGKVASNLVVTLDWNELADNPKTKTCLLTAVPVDITLTKLEFDKAASQIKYNITNNAAAAINLALKCENTDSGNKAEITTALPANWNLNGNGSSNEQTLPIDFKGEDKAGFNLELLFGNLPINFKYNDGTGAKSVLSATVKTEAKQVDLKLVNDIGNDFTPNKLQLKGANKEIKFKVALNGIPQDVIALDRIDLNKLKLAISKNEGDAKLMSGGTEMAGAIPGGQLIDGGGAANTITLNLEQGDDKKAKFTLQLQYDKKGDNSFQPIGDYLTVEWEE